MKTNNHYYRYYFRDQNFIWCSEYPEDFKDVIYGEDTMSWELTVIAVSLGHPMKSNVRLVSYQNEHYWIEHKVLPIFEGARVCGMEGFVTLTETR